MEVTAKIRRQWMKQPNGILRIVAFLLSVTVLVLIHTIKSEHIMDTTRFASACVRGRVDKTSGSNYTKAADGRVGVNEEVEDDESVPVVVMGDKIMPMDRFVKGFHTKPTYYKNVVEGFRTQPTYYRKFIESVSAGNLFAITFFLACYLTEETVIEQQILAEICFDMVHTVLNAIAGTFMLCEHQHPLLAAEDQPPLLIAGVLFLALTCVFFTDMCRLVGVSDPADPEPEDEKPPALEESNATPIVGA